MNNKISFIVELLNSKKITTPQKEKLLHLTAEELKNTSITDDQVLSEIAMIKNQMIKINQLLQTQKEEPKEEHRINDIEPKLEDNIIGKLPLYINPKNLSDFLKKYNQNPILKYTCHEIDDLSDFLKHTGLNSFEFETYIALVRKEYNKIANFYYDKINKNIQGLIWTYLSGGKTWSSDNITINWDSKELNQWCIDNPSRPPNPGLNLKRRSKFDGFEFPSFNTKNTNSTVRTFSQLVIHFKHLFHIRSDNSLNKLILIKNEVEKFNEKITFNINLPENIEFFTDVDKVLQAYAKIIDMILDFSEKNQKEIPIINLGLKEENEYIIFSIHHKNSTYGKTISNCIGRAGERERNLIDNLINGVSLLILKADFGEGQYAEINLWNGKPKLALQIDKFEGVEFQLKF